MKDNKGSKKDLKVERPNPVHRDIIHSETIHKEMKHEGKNIMKNFQLNPNKVYILPEKPNYINHFEKKKPIIAGELEGGFTEDPVEEAFSTEKLNKVLHSSSLVPRQKFNHPLTANQEIGWFATQMARPKSVKDHRLNSCPITQFASDYYELKKINPFKVR